METYNGYQPDFIHTDVRVDFPNFPPHLNDDLAPVGDGGYELKFHNYSLMLSKSRKFPYFTATNIHGGLFKQIDRKDVTGGSDKWLIDPRVKEYQWGSALYSAPKSEFDKGHMTKREDPQWGETKEAARQGALSTFFYANAVPQSHQLNGVVWRKLETYILNKQSVKHNLKINLFTGPVLSDTDPHFVSVVQGERVKIPTLFWKVIYYTTSDGKLNRVAFLMGQRQLLEKTETIAVERDIDDATLFLDFADAETYQVNVSTVEQLTGLIFASAEDRYNDARSIPLIVQNVQVTRDIDAPEDPSALDYEIRGLMI